MRKRRKSRRKKSERLATTEKLVRVLESQNDSRLHEMIEKARDGYYDDYKTTVSAPICLLVIDLEYHGYKDLAERARNGEFDAQAWEGKEWMREEGNALILASFDHETERSNDGGT